MMNRMLEMKRAQTGARTSNYDVCHKKKGRLPAGVGINAWADALAQAVHLQLQVTNKGEAARKGHMGYEPVRWSDWLRGPRHVVTGRRHALLCLRKDTITVPSCRARQRNLWSNAAWYKCKSYKSPRWWLKDITVTSQPIIKQTGTIRDKRGHTLNNEPLCARTFSPRWNIRVIFH